MLEPNIAIYDYASFRRGYLALTERQTWLKLTGDEECSRASWVPPPCYKHSFYLKSRTAVLGLAIAQTVGRARDGYTYPFLVTCTGDMTTSLLLTPHCAELSHTAHTNL